MIRINLLLARKEKKKAGLRKEGIILIGSLAALVLLLGGIQWKMSSDKADLVAKIDGKRKEIARFKALSAEVAKARDDQKSLQEKINVINALKKEKASPARILDELSIYKPEKMHLESLKKEGPKLGIEGIALDDETIANFMTNLRKSRLFKNVDLVVSEQSEQSKVKLKKFTLSCEIFLM